MKCSLASKITQNYTPDFQNSSKITLQGFRKITLHGRQQRYVQGMPSFLRQFHLKSAKFNSRFLPWNVLGPMNTYLREN